MKIRLIRCLYKRHYSCTGCYWDIARCTVRIWDRRNWADICNYSRQVGSCKYHLYTDSDYSSRVVVDNWYLRNPLDQLNGLLSCLSWENDLRYDNTYRIAIARITVRLWHASSVGWTRRTLTVVDLCFASKTNKSSWLYKNVFGCARGRKW